MSNRRSADNVLLVNDFTIIETSDEDAILSIELEEKNDMEIKRNEILKQLIQLTGDKCQKALHLYYFLQYNMKKVAESRGLSGPHQAKKAMARCREKLRKLIAENPNLQNFLKQSL